MSAPSGPGLHRRRFLLSGGSALLGGAGLLLSGCDRASEAPAFRDLLGRAEGLTRTSQRLLQGRSALAREFAAADISPEFKANGTIEPDTDIYAALLDNGFADWRLQIDGLVDRPAALSLAELRSLPSRTQITRHDCVEGWSAIGKWTGVPLGLLLKSAGLKPNARYAVFHCADDLDGEAGKGGEQSPGLYYESIDLIDAFHPQTILAYDMNDAPLPVAHGAPLRLRVERQLGYKHAKYLMRIEIAERLDHLGRGKGGYWEDRGYEWYAGI